MQNRYLLLLLAFLVAVNLGNARALPNPGSSEDATAQFREVDKRDPISLKTARRDVDSTLWPKDLGAPGANHELSAKVQLEARAKVPLQTKKKLTTKKPTKAPTNPAIKQPTTINGGRRKKPISCPLKKKPAKKTTPGVAKPAGLGRRAQRQLFPRKQSLYDTIERNRKASPLSDKLTQAQLETAFSTGGYTNLAQGNEPSLQSSMEKIMGLRNTDTFISRAVTNTKNPWSGSASDKTSMKYLDSYHPTKGVIVVQDVNNGSPPKTPYSLRFSDVLMKEWLEICAEAGKAASGLKWIIHDTVVHAQTEPLIEEFEELVSCGDSAFKEVTAGTGIYKLTYEAHKEWFLRFLGSGNGSPTAWLVADYAKVLGGKKIVAIYVDTTAFGLLFELGK